LRLRPILMTSFAFIFGMMPLVIATGAGGVSRQELGSAVVIGLSIATFFGIFLVPTMFAMVERIVRWNARRRAHRHEPSPGGPSSPQVAPAHSEPSEPRP